MYKQNTKKNPKQNTKNCYYIYTVCVCVYAFGVRGAYFTHLTLPRPLLDKHPATRPKKHTLGGV